MSPQQNSRYGSNHFQFEFVNNNGMENHGFVEDPLVVSPSNFGNKENMQQNNEPPPKNQDFLNKQFKENFITQNLVCMTSGRGFINNNDFS